MKLYSVKSTCELANLVARLTSRDPLEKITVFCEDKFTLELELAIAKRHGGSFGVNVFSFNRFMHKFLQSNEKCLSQESCALVIKHLLFENKEELKCFKRVYDTNLASAVYELIAQLKSAKVSAKDLERARDQSMGNLKRKLADLAFIFGKYEEFLKTNGLTDGNNRLYKLPKFFDEDEEIKNTKVIIAGFPSLNKTLCDIFRSLVKNAKEVCFAVVARDDDGRDSYKDSIYTNEVYNFVTNEFSTEIIKMPTSSLKEQVLNRLYSYEVVGNNESNNQNDNKNIYAFKAKDRTGEIIQVAKSIRRQVVSGAKYSDFALTAESLEDYEPIIKRIFYDYEIPYFLDVSKNLSNHPLTRLVCSYLTLARRNFDRDCVFGIIKNPLFTPDKELSDVFEEYYLTAAINRNTVKEKFVYEHEKLEELNNLREKLVYCVSFLTEQGYKAGGKIVFKDAVLAINKFLDYLGVFERIKEFGAQIERTYGEKSNVYLDEFQKLSEFNERGASRFTQILEESVELIGEHEYSLTEVKNLILSGMTSGTIPFLPNFDDCVYIGDFRSAKYSAHKTVFAIGLTDGVPANKLDTALLCDRDLDVMEKGNVLVEPKIKEVNRRSRENACMAVTSFLENLIVSYPLTDSDGKEHKASEIFEAANGLVNFKYFNSQPVSAEHKGLGNYLTSRAACFNFFSDVGDYFEGKDGSEESFRFASAYYYFLKDSQTQNSTLANEFLQNRLLEMGRYIENLNTESSLFTEGVNYAQKGLSATAIEGYFSCPYANFLSRGLRLKERAQGKILANELGNMVHAVAEGFVKRLTEEKSFDKKLETAYNDALKISKEEFERVAELPEYARYLRSASGKKSFSLIQKECMRFCEDLFYGIVQSNFKPKETEIKFGIYGNGKTLPAIKVQTELGEKNVTGMVDRLDVFEDKMRIIDYKTGKVDAGEIDEALFTGKKLQLFLYAKPFERKYQPVGAYYFPIADSFSEDGVDDSMALKGKTVEDIDVIRALDNTITPENTKGVYLDINAEKTAKGEFKYRQKMLLPNEFSSYIDYATKIAGKGIEEINKGLIVASPYKGICDYCKYHGICGYDHSIGNKTREVKNVSRQVICDAVNPPSESDKIQNNAKEEEN